MSLLADILDEATVKGLRLVVIGGHAVNAHGYSRLTKDLDLLIRGTDAAAWESLLQLRGFAVFRKEQTFLQYKQPPAFPWPLDLMLVNDATFKKMWLGATERAWADTTARFPCLDDLLALKLHALCHGPAGRGFKDFMDILSLADENRVDLRSDRFRVLCEQYGTAEIYERLLAFKSGTA